MKLPRIHLKSERQWAAVIALVAVNTYAVIGQAQWAYKNLSDNVPAAIGFAITLESISLFLTAQASAALLANDKSAGLRGMAYLAGLGIGVMNYVAHCGKNWQPTAMAIAFGALSALSPWLWAIYSRRTHRDSLAREGLIDPRAVKIPTMLWFLYPKYGMRLLRLGVLTGVNHLPTLRAQLSEQDALSGLPMVDAVYYAYGHLGSYSQHQARVWLAQRGVIVPQAVLDEASAGRPPALSPVPVVATAHVPAQPPMLTPPDGSPWASPIDDVPADAETDAPVSPAGGIASDAVAVRYHNEQLTGLRSKRDKVRYAFHVMGDIDVPKAVRWLEQHGHPVSRQEAYVVANKLADQGITSTVDMPAGFLRDTIGTDALVYGSGKDNTNPHNGSH